MRDNTAIVILSDKFVHDDVISRTLGLNKISKTDLSERRIRDIPEKMVLSGKFVRHNTISRTLGG